MHPYIQTIHRNDSHQNHTIYVNGISNTPEYTSEVTRPFRSVSHHLEHLVNPTEGTRRDLCRIASMKRGMRTKSADLLAKRLSVLAETQNEILLVGHSEGGLIIEKALDTLPPQDLEKLAKRITVHTFGSSSFYKNRFGLHKITHHVSLFDTLCFIQSPKMIFFSFIGFFKVLSQKLLYKKDSAKISHLATKFYWPNSFDIMSEHTIREGRYNAILTKKIEKQSKQEEVKSNPFA